MSRLRSFSETDPSRVLFESHDGIEIAVRLGALGISFERWPVRNIAPDDTPERIMELYRPEIDRLVAENGFRSVDVVSINPDHPDREALRAKFLEEHSHKEDEVRFFVRGSGLFTLHIGHQVHEVLCEAQDLTRVPDGTRHWFDMGPEPLFTAIRFFTQPDGWVGYFTGSDIAARFPRYEPAS